MVKHTQTIRRLLPKDCLSVFDHFVKLALKGLNSLNIRSEVWRRSLNFVLPRIHMWMLVNCEICRQNLFLPAYRKKKKK